MKDHNNNQTEIRVRCLKKATVKQLNNIANYYGLTITRFVRQELMRIISATPEHIKEYKDDND